LDGVPDNRGAEIPVGVDGEVAEIDHLTPWGFRMVVCAVRRNVVRSFADDGQVMNHRIHDLFVVFKRFEIDAGDIALDFGDRVKDVLNPESPVSSGSLLGTRPQ
jgi:hypothetical protein